AGASVPRGTRGVTCRESLASIRHLGWAEAQSDGQTNTSGGGPTPAGGGRDRLRRHGGRSPMIVGVPTEIKPQENRVGLIPSGVKELSSRSHQVLVQQGAGLGSGISDDEYIRAGATIVPTAEE